MGSKCKMIVGILVLLLIFSIVVTYVISWQKEKDYGNKLISVLSKQEKTTVQDIFSFEFDRAYIFTDCYLSGKDFAESYDLDISIEQVESGVSENIQRIVFVNEEGSFVYEFKCDSNEMLLTEKGVVIYPETVIERKSSVQEKPVILYFDSSEHYDSNDALRFEPVKQEYQFDQSIENVEKVELCRYDCETNVTTPVMTFNEDIGDALLTDIGTMDCYRPGNRPRYYGEIVLLITYTNGEAEVIGMGDAASVDSEGAWSSKAYYFNETEWCTVVLKYVDAELVPELGEYLE